MATARLLGVTAFPLFSKISSDFCVNLLIYPQVGILFQFVNGRGIAMFVSDSDPWNSLLGGSTSYAKHLFCGSSLMIWFQMMRGNLNRCFWITWWNTSETPSPGYQIPLRHVCVTGSYHETGGLGQISFCSFVKCHSAAVKSVSWSKKFRVNNTLYNFCCGGSDIPSPLFVFVTFKRYSSFYNSLSLGIIGDSCIFYRPSL